MLLLEGDVLRVLVFGEYARALSSGGGSCG